MPRTLGTGAIDRELDVALLRTSVLTAQSIGGTPMLMKILQRRARKILREYPRADVPDWVEALANGDPERPKLLAWVITQMKMDEEEDGTPRAN